MIDMIGWTSSGILLVTLVIQIHKQWKLETHEGVSRWLFIGQLAASLGFTAYSVGTGNLVFIITNSFLALGAMIGIYIYYRHSRN